jgi:hypothetical protein
MRTLVFFFLLLSGTAFAQQAAPDSMYIFEPARRELAYIQQNGTQLVSSPVKKVNQLSAGYHLASGHFRTSQQAEDTRDIIFRTSGISTLGRFKLFGDFRFQRTWQDSLAYTLQGVPDPANPYYFISEKAGKFERINYSLNGLAAYELSPDKIFLASGIQYTFNTASRSVDPRPSVQTFNLIVSPEFIYKKKQHTAGFGVLLGYQNERTSVGYKNDTYSSGSLYPERILYRLEGYGYTTETGTGTRKFERDGNYSGMQFNYAYQDTIRYLRGRFQYKRHKEDIEIPLEKSANKASVGTFFFDQADLSVLAGLTGRRSVHQLSLNLGYDSGEDRKAAQGNKRNYTYSAYRAQLGYSFLYNSNTSTAVEMGVHTQYYQQRKHDISTAHLLDYSYLEPGIDLSVYKHYKDASRLKLSLAPAVRLPLNYSLQQPDAAVYPFTYGIAYPEYTYWSSTLANVGLHAEWVTPRLFKGVYSSIAINGNYYTPLTTGEVYEGSAFIPSGNFFMSSLSFNLYF